MTDTSPAGVSPAAQEKFDLAVFIGRFQPWHEGHQSVVKMGFERARNVLLLVGSANAPRSHRNPFTYDERVEMIGASLRSASKKILYVQPLEDAAYNDNQWIASVQREVEFCLDDIAEAEGISVAARRKMRVALLGHSKDRTGFYLNLFTSFESIQAPNFRNVSSTPMRMAYFSMASDMWLANADGHRPGDKQSEHLVPSAVRDFLIKFRETKEYNDIRGEYEFILNYRAQWASAPFPPIHVTADALVIQSGHVLLVRRKFRPGRGLWALPGGFVHQDESIRDGMIRELVEETKIAISPSDLEKSIVASRVFDDPHRDARGRVITHGFRIDLPPKRVLPRITKKRLKLAEDDLETVEGADDAEFAKWFPLAEIKREMMFVDHFDIIRALGAFN